MIQPARRGRLPDYRAALTGDMRGLRIGVLRHLYEDDAPIQSVAKNALEAALDVLRGLGAVLEDARIRPAQVYHDVKITGAESELLAVHEPALRTRLADFGEDFLGRTLGALLISGADYVQASRWRRVLIAEMAPLYTKYDVLVTASPGPAPRLECLAHDRFLAAPVTDHAIQRDRRSRAGAMHRLHAGRIAAVDADRRAAVRRRNGAARRARLRSGDTVAHAAAGAGCRTPRSPPRCRRFRIPLRRSSVRRGATKSPRCAAAPG